MGVLSKEQSERLRRVAPAVLLLWRRVLLALMMLKPPKRKQIIQSLLYSAVSHAPAFLIRLFLELYRTEVLCDFLWVAFSFWRRPLCAPTFGRACAH
jgi:hypothetical protein